MLFNEPKLLKCEIVKQVAILTCVGFSALQRAEIAEMHQRAGETVKVGRFSALQRAEIAEIIAQKSAGTDANAFQCSSTSRNC